jgi:ribosome-binding protein aMBF1 (putative translation factor)
MTIDDYRVQFGWSRQQLADQAGIDPNTLRSAIKGGRVYRAKVGKIAEAISRELVRRGMQPITYTDLEGVTYAD